MSAKLRHWKEKDGRFWARIAVPVALRQFFSGKTELTEPLGGDRRAAGRKHAAAVARLQDQIEKARLLLGLATATRVTHSPLHTITVTDLERAVWTHYVDALQRDELKRAAMPTPAEIDAEFERFMQRVEVGEGDAGRDPIGALTLSSDYEMKARARYFDEQLRNRRLSALRLELASGNTRLIDAMVQRFVAELQLNVEPGSIEWRDLAHRLTRAEIEALQRTLERDRGVFNGAPSDPIVKPPASAVAAPDPVPLKKLFNDYIATRQAIGKHQDGGATWKSVFSALIKFLGHDDARRITRRNLLDWRDSLMASGKAAKTVSDKHLAAIKAVLKWAFENDRLPTNEAETVRQEVPRKVQTREKGFTTSEAVKILRASLSHVPAETANPSNREQAHTTATKRWVPLLCAFTGARPSEMTQLRKEDVREDGKRWILRITPDAGSVKTGQYRDVPLHHQVIALGFSDFVEAAKQGPLFHNAKTPERYLAGARASAGKLSQWLNELKLVPVDVPPNYGWRHRFKTQGLELGASVRVLDGIQGHPGKTASDGYGDVTITAKLNVIDALAEYDLGD